MVTITAEMVIQQALESVRKGRNRLAEGERAGAPEAILEMGRHALDMSLKMMDAAVAIPSVAKLLEEREDLAKEVVEARAARH